MIAEKGSDAEIVFPRSAIASVRPARRGLMKQVVITLSDDREFVFEYGLLSVRARRRHRVVARHGHAVPNPDNLNAVPYGRLLKVRPREGRLNTYP